MKTNSDDIMLCPSCNGEWTHIEKVIVIAREEDAAAMQITVDAITADIKVGEGKPIGRRHTITLVGWCERGCGEISFQFRQNKGNTFLTERTGGNK